MVAKGLSGSFCLLDKLLKRNLIGSIYPESTEYRLKLKSMLQNRTTVYAGFDATSNSLHVGNLATIMNLIHFHRHGHRVICLIGDATTQIGDPSGHTKDRLKLDKNLIEENAISIEENLIRLFNNQDLIHDNNNIGDSNILDDKKSTKENPIIVRNSQWYKGRDVIDFVSDVFREVRVGWMLHKKSIQERLQSHDGMNVSEFCYQIFQAYDWLELRKLYDCRLQVGGSDQGGNIYTGHDLIKRYTGEKDSIGLLAPLVTNKYGKKLGKSPDINNGKNNNIWLDPKKTSPFELYQFFHKVPDKEIEKSLKVFSLYDDKTIEDLTCNYLKKPEDIWYCQRKLAENVCLLVHGEAGLESAKCLTNKIFNKVSK